MSRTVRRRADADTADAARRRLDGLRPVSSPARLAAEGWVPEPPTRPTGPPRAPGPHVLPPSSADETAVGQRVGSHRAPRWPSILDGARLAIAPRAVVALLLVALVSVLVAGAWAWRARAQVVDVAPPRAVDRSSSLGGAPPAGAHPSARPAVSSLTSLSTVAPSGSPSTALMVHVVGQVRRPGVVTLAAGARVLDAVNAAGGAKPTAQLSALNLARALVDGEQVVVPAPGEVVVPPVTSGQGSATSAAGTTGGPDQPVNLNTATLDQLEELPGVGPVLAQRILDWRGEHGSFRSVDEMQEVSGIGAAKYADLEPRVRT